MRWFRVGLAAGLALSLVACGGSGGKEAADITTTAAPASTTTTAPKPKPTLVGLPMPLPEVEDPGTIDPQLGAFPTDEARDYQYAWVALARNGRDFVENMRQQLSALRDLEEGDVYIDGVYACVDLNENLAVDTIESETGARYQDFLEDVVERQLTDEEVMGMGVAVVETAVATLCPEVQEIIDSPELFTDTPVALRTILGVGEADLSEDDANLFANSVCQELTRGKTTSRLVTDLAEQYEYPDDLAESLINYVDGQVCS